MKRFLLITMSVFWLTSHPSLATNIDQADIPDSVITGLKADHPGARNIKVTRQRHFGLTLYEVQFKTHGSQHEALFDTRGKPFGHEEPVKQLPEKVTHKLKQVFNKFTIESAVGLHHPNGRVEYEIDLRNADELWEVVTNEDGKILVKEKL